MKNKEITIYELLGLIKDGKAPKKIKYYDAIFEFKNYNYYLKGRDEINYSLFYKLAALYMSLNDTVEILPEENDEWEDIEEIENIDDFGVGNLTELNSKIINKLIKNQRKIIEKLDKNEIMFDYYVEKLEAKEKLESKDEKD